MIIFVCDGCEKKALAEPGARADNHPRKPPAELRPSLQLHWVYGFDYQSEVENTSNTVEARQKVAA
jgi:hypothetical protein